MAFEAVPLGWPCGGGPGGARLKEGEEALMKRVRGTREVGFALCRAR